jgi:hypothetical protein
MVQCNNVPIAPRRAAAIHTRPSPQPIHAHVSELHLANDPKKMFNACDASHQYRAYNHLVLIFRVIDPIPQLPIRDHIIILLSIHTIQ